MAQLAPRRPWLWLWPWGRARRSWDPAATGDGEKLQPPRWSWQRGTSAGVETTVPRLSTAGQWGDAQHRSWERWREEGARRRIPV